MQYTETGPVAKLTFATGLYLLLIPRVEMRPMNILATLPASANCQYT